MEASAVKRGWIYVKTENVLWASGHENCPGAVSVCVVSTSKCFVTPTSWPSWHKGNDPIDPSRVAFLFPNPLWTKCKTLSGQNLFMPAPQVRRDESNRKERWRHSSNSLLSFLLSLHSHWVTNRQALLMILHLLKLSIECFSFFPLGWFYVSNTFKAPRMHTPAQQNACKVVSDCCFPKEKPWGSNWSNTWNIGPYCKLHLTSLVWTMLGCFGWFLILIKYHCPRWMETYGLVRGEGRPGFSPVFVLRTSTRHLRRWTCFDVLHFYSTW